MAAMRKMAVAVSMALAAGAAQAQVSGGVVKIGVMNDMSSLYADIAGPGSVVAARMAVEDYMKSSKSKLKVEILSADHQNKPDVGSSIARQWYDVDGVDMIMDVPTSSVVLAVNQVTKEKNKALIVSTGATSDLTGKACTPNSVHWTYDTWSLAHGTGQAMVETGGDTWFFLTSDYAFGYALEAYRLAPTDEAVRAALEPAAALPRERWRSATSTTAPTARRTAASPSVRSRRRSGRRFARRSGRSDPRGGSTGTARR